MTTYSILNFVNRKTRILRKCMYQNSCSITDTCRQSHILAESCLLTRYFLKSREDLGERYFHACSRSGLSPQGVWFLITERREPCARATRGQRGGEGKGSSFTLSFALRRARTIPPLFSPYLAPRMQTMPVFKTVDLNSETFELRVKG